MLMLCSISAFCHCVFSENLRRYGSCFIETVYDDVFSRKNICTYFRQLLQMSRMWVNGIHSERRRSLQVRVFAHLMIKDRAYITNHITYNKNNNRWQSIKKKKRVIQCLLYYDRKLKSRHSWLY